MNRQSFLMLACVVLVVSGSGFFLRYWQSNQVMGNPGVVLVEDSSMEKPPIRLPDWVLNYVGEDLEVSEIELEALPDDTTISRRRYKHPNGFFIDLTVVLMGLDRTSIHKPQFCLTGAGFHIEETTPTNIQMHQPVAQTLPTMRLKTLRRFQGQEYSGLLYYWFVDDQHVTSSHSERMWLMVRDLFTKGRLQRWASISVSSIVIPGQEENAYRHMESFIRAATPVFQSTTASGSSSGYPSQSQ